MQASRRADHEEQAPRRIDRAGGRDPPRAAIGSRHRAQVALPDRLPGRGVERVDRACLGGNEQQLTAGHAECERGGEDGAVECRRPGGGQPRDGLACQGAGGRRVAQLVVVRVARPRVGSAADLAASVPAACARATPQSEERTRRELESARSRRGTGQPTLRHKYEYLLKPARRSDRPRAAPPRWVSCRPGSRRPRALPSSPGPFPRSRR